MDNYKHLREQLVNFLDGSQAHITFDDAIKDFPYEPAGKKTPGMPHTPWEIIEHIRIAQFDIYQFSIDSSYISPTWPDGYWPENATPKSKTEWDNSVSQIKKDLQAMKDLVMDPKTDLFKTIPHGTGQNIFREVLVASQHNSYHLGQLMVLKKSYQ